MPEVQRKLPSLVPRRKLLATESLGNLKFRFSERSSMNKSLTMLNISGVLYRSTGKKLERKSSFSSQPSEHQLLIRGSKFILDESGKRLRLESEGSDSKMSRIDIGGLTYKASKNGGFERDNSHEVRNHLALAKTKSISLLSKSRFQKTNAVCQIYRRLGKCLAYANGRCQMLHDPRYVVVCPDFIRGACTNEKCLRSHNVNLHKMPVCSYFLQGLCKKQGCPYLHKKVSDDAKPCTEFLKGYCPLADQVNNLRYFQLLLNQTRLHFSAIYSTPFQRIRTRACDVSRRKSLPRNHQKLPSRLNDITSKTLHPLKAKTLPNDALSDPCLLLFLFSVFSWL